MKHKSVIILILSLITASWPALADDDHERARALVESGEIMPLEDLLAKVREHQPGRVLEVELELKQGKPVYEIEILGPEGTVHEFLFDAVNGSMLSRKEEH